MGRGSGLGIWGEELRGKAAPPQITMATARGDQEERAVASVEWERQERGPLGALQWGLDWLSYESQVP